jgi:hypothetical protein
VSPAVSAVWLSCGLVVPYQNPPTRPATVTTKDQKNVRIKDKKGLP